MANGNSSLLKEAVVNEFQLYCRGFTSLASIHTHLFSKLGNNIAIDSLESYNFSGYINSLELVLKRNTRHGSGVQLALSKVHQGRGNKLSTYARLKDKYEIEPYLNSNLPAK